MVRAWIVARLVDPEEQPTEQPRQTTAAYFGERTRTLASRQEPSLDVRLMTRTAWVAQIEHRTPCPERAPSIGYGRSLAVTHSAPIRRGDRYGHFPSWCYPTSAQDVPVHVVQEAGVVVSRSV